MSCIARASKASSPRATHAKVGRERHDVRLVDAAHARERVLQMRHVLVVDASANQIGRARLLRLVRLDVAACLLSAESESARRAVMSKGIEAAHLQATMMV